MVVSVVVEYVMIVDTEVASVNVVEVVENVEVVVNFVKVTVDVEVETVRTTDEVVGVVTVDV